MNFKQELGLADSCCYGCPNTDFQVLERLVTSLVSDKDAIEAAGLSVNDMELFNKAVDLATSNAVRTVDTARDQCSDKGAWWPDTRVHLAMPPLVCGQLGGVVVLTPKGEALESMSK